MLSSSDLEDALTAKLPVNEIFATIQGEATFTGTPSMFVRLQGCDVGCPWCDTKHTWPINPTEDVPIATMLAKTGDSQQYAGMSVAQIVEVCKKGPRHIVITGGEPFMHNLSELSKALIADGHSVQVETSGTELPFAHNDTFVTVSPKIDMPGKRNVLMAALERANEIKMPVGKPADIEKLLSLLNKHAGVRERAINGRVTIWLQPISQSKKATELCVASATKYGWRVSIQTHKLLGVR